MLLRVDPAVRYITDTYSPLEGATITHAYAAKMDLGFALALLIDTKDGQRITAEVWRDDEGNGPGALAFTKVGKTPKSTKSLREHVWERMSVWEDALNAIANGDGTPATRTIAANALKGIRP
jgi:hypothetical protein